MSGKWMAVGLVTLALSACGGNLPTLVGPYNDDEIVGTWLSTGANVPLFLQMSPLSARKILATFSGTGDYTMVYTNASNNNTTEHGMWNVDAVGRSGAIRVIALWGRDDVPDSRGIFQVTATGMKFEVVQIRPYKGISPPTVAGGFGSSGIAGVFVGTYVKQ